MSTPAFKTVPFVWNQHFEGLLELEKHTFGLEAYTPDYLKTLSITGRIFVTVRREGDTDTVFGYVAYLRKHLDEPHHEDSKIDATVRDFISGNFHSAQGKV